METLVTDEFYSEPVYTIGHAAKKLGVAAPTIRMYEKAGLLLSFRTETNRRMYSKRDLQHLEQIIHLIRKQGLNIEAIRRLAAGIPCWLMTNCPGDICKQCIAYQSSTKPCWLLPGMACQKSKTDCRLCDVYLTFPQRLQDLKSFHKSGLK